MDYDFGRLILILNIKLNNKYGTNLSVSKLKNGLNIKITSWDSSLNQITSRGKG